MRMQPINHNVESLAHCMSRMIKQHIDGALVLTQILFLFSSSVFLGKSFAPNISTMPTFVTCHEDTRHLMSCLSLLKT